MTVKGSYDWDELWNPTSFEEHPGGFEFPAELIERHRAAKEAFLAACEEVKAIQRSPFKWSPS